ncbi:asparaginase [Streptomyces sp. NPDC059850]|uniref:asparaginase n=1 Tax=Streptomyces sp. NPDC059850 TaxID=3346970 RepID=UPI003646C27A
MRTVVVITTGGTIASTSDEDGAKVASVSGATLVSGLTAGRSVPVRVVEAMNQNSYAIGFEQMDEINRLVKGALSDIDTCGVVVTHGTDTLEESAMLVDLCHGDPRPVVFTGAQLSHDDRAADGPRNLADAIATAASPQARDLGVLVCFAGVLHSARGTRKVHNSTRSAFLDADHGPVGTVNRDGRVRFHTQLRRAVTGLPPEVAISGTRVDIVAIYPGCDAAALEAVLARGARGIVLEATGYGNANADIAAAVARCTRAGVHVALSSRVAAGAITPVYGGGGGGVDLVAAGAIVSGHLRPSQARVLLAALIASGRTHDQIVSAFATEPDRSEAVPPPLGVLP